MKALHDRTQNMQGQRVAADLAARVAEIFEQYPILCGFSVQERSTLTQERAMVRLHGEVYLADVAVITWPGLSATQAFYDDIACTLLDLMEEQPEVLELLPGRTFARTVH